MSNIDTLDAAVIVIGGFCVWPYACRTNWLNWVRYKWQVVSFNLALSSLVLFSLYHGVTGTASIDNLIAVVGAALWIVLTWPTWRCGPPEYAERHPVKVAQFLRQYARQSGGDRS